VTARIANNHVIRNVLIVAAINCLLGFLLYDPDDKDPLWYEVVSDLIAFPACYIGGLIITQLNLTQLPSDRYVRPNRFIALLPYIAMAITLTVAACFVDVRFKAAPPPDILQRLEAMADTGDDHAACVAAAAYYNGIRVAKDLPKAAYLYSEAAMHGNTLGQQKLGFMYARGEGVPKNMLEAYKWISLESPSGIRKPPGFSRLG
jgi:hypothetical protein